EHETCGHSRAPAARGASREVFARPWITGRRKRQIEARATNPKLVRRQLAKAYDASRGQLVDPLARTSASKSSRAILGFGTGLTLLQTGCAERARRHGAAQAKHRAEAEYLRTRSNSTSRVAVEGGRATYS